MASTKTTVMDTVKKSATKPATKAATKPATKAATKTATKTAHGLTLNMLASLPAKAESFLSNALSYHKKAGSVEVKKDAFVLTGTGKEKMGKRKGLAHAQKAQQEGGKSLQGTEYHRAPAGFPVPYVFPFGAREEGTGDSQAAFAALMLSVSK